jgi:hypothetical protein
MGVLRAFLPVLFVVVPVLAPRSGRAAGADVRPEGDWKQILSERIPLFGHRNWIVIADSAYPDQSEPGIETITAEADQSEVLNYTLRLLSHSQHVTPAVFLDQELDFLPENDAPGIGSYRETLKSLLEGHDVSVRPHEQMLAQIGQASQHFEILIIKTRALLPYTTVFLRLDCAYWPADAEERLRKAMREKKP